MTAQQLAEWEAYHRIDPIGEEREDIRMAYICSTVANSVIGAVAGKKGKLTKVGDFMPKWDEQTRVKQQTNEEMYATLMGMATPRNNNK